MSTYKSLAHKIASKPAKKGVPPTFKVGSALGSLYGNRGWAKPGRVWNQNAH